MSRIAKKHDRVIRMPASDEYKQRLREWIEAEVVKYGSHEKLAARLAIPGYDVTGSWLRKMANLDPDKSIKKELGSTFLVPLARYLGKTSAEVEAWLRTGEKLEFKVGQVDSQQIKGICDLNHLLELEVLIIDRIREISATLSNLNCPKTKEEFCEAIAIHAPLIEARQNIPQKRTLEIATGGTPTIIEVGHFSQYFVGEEPEAIVDRLAGFYPEVKSKPKQARQTGAAQSGKKSRA